MNEAATKTEFLSAVRDDRPCFVCVKIKALQSLVSNLGALDLLLRPTSSGLSAIRGLCPLCTSWVPGETLGMILVATQMEREKLTFSSYGDISHLIDACCINDNCVSQDIILIWQGDQSIKRQLVTHLDRA